MASIATELEAIEEEERGEDVRDAFVSAAEKIAAEALPDVTEEDAGKLLCVNSSGEWVAGTP